MVCTTIYVRLNRYSMTCAQSRSPLPEARRAIGHSLQSLAQLPLDESLSLPDTFEVIARHLRPDHPNREVGVVSIRLISCPDILSMSELRDGQRYIARLIEVCCPDLIKKVLTDKNTQNHEKLFAAQSVHQDATERLRNLTEAFNSFDDLRGRRQIIMRALNHGPTKSYLTPFGFTSLQLSVTSLLQRIDDLAQSQGQELQGGMQ